MTRPPIGRAGEALERLLPFLVIVAVAAAGFMWAVRPRLDAYLAARADAAALGERVRTLQASIDRSRGLAAADPQAALAEFEARASADDRVADVAALLARAALDSAPAGQIGGLTIETGDRVPRAAAAAAATVRLAGGQGRGLPDDGPDARFGLFPYAVSWTPVRVRFDSTFGAIGAFLSTLRDMPTIVEIRSVRLTRGLPLMTAEIVVRVYRRGAPEQEG
ncbi:MAG TPA: hypothetical protein PLE61_02500 [Vicinamibacterales bacterium]|nr:hypothetical protein [Vicinamibacterales bacterium]HPW19658.1 hypothetical protein [Vicinamibacterales bacterium]